MKLFTGRAIPALLVILVLSLPDQAFSSEKAADDNQRLFAFDEQHWVLFYDLPSRRFRAIRDNFVKRNFEDASRDLRVTENYLLIEASRASPLIQERLELVAEALATAANDIDQLELTTNDLDALFARAHWLLAQHYLELALLSRDTENYKTSAHYLMATAHHVERTILWSNMRIEPAILVKLENIRKLSNTLLESRKPKLVYREKPIRQAWVLIQDTGEFLDRKILINPEP